MTIHIHILICYILLTELTKADLPLLHHILKVTATRWHYIGLNLNIPFDELEKIRCHIGYALQGHEEYLLRMLVKWLESSEKKTVQSLKLALKCDEFGNLASQLLHQLNSSKL